MTRNKIGKQIALPREKRPIDSPLVCVCVWCGCGGGGWGVGAGRVAHLSLSESQLRASLVFARVQGSKRQQ
jgi:hypothetical protein